MLGLTDSIVKLHLRILHIYVLALADSINLLYSIVLCALHCTTNILSHLKKQALWELFSEKFKFCRLKKTIRDNSFGEKVDYTSQQCSYSTIFSFQDLFIQTRPLYSSDKVASFNWHSQSSEGEYVAVTVSLRDLSFNC